MLHIWRYDVAENRWYGIAVDENHPVYRGEVSYTQTDDDGVVIFGEYSSMLNGWCQSETGFLECDECFEYLSKYDKWVLIQSQTRPVHRAYAGIDRARGHYQVCKRQDINN